jgi:small-conductance mechanosensitive channel
MRVFCCVVSVFVLLALAAPHATWAQQPPVAAGAAQNAGPSPSYADLPAGSGVRAAEVTLDGLVLFRVRGISAKPAKQRAAEIRRQLIALAENPDIDPGATDIETHAEYAALSIDGERVTYLFPADAELEQAPLEIVAAATMQRISRAIEQYREARSPRSLLRSTGVLLLITLLAALLVWATQSLFLWLNRLVESKVKKRIEDIERASHRLVDAAQLWSWLGGWLRGLRTVVVVGITLTWLNAALGLYPWTRPFATSIFRLILNPLQKMGTSIVASLPDLAFLVILVIIVRFVLQAIRTFFLRIHRGWLRLETFDREWAMPTYRILRILIIAFALVVAYPYIPGSESAAFKGVSLFLGVIFSIGSGSFVSNMMAGYSLTYRGAFRPGERVKIGEHVGVVEEVRAMSTRLRSLKNEAINIPNSEVLSSTVVNYSAFPREEGVILHTEVGIGYDAPWRQVEAMLLEAAARTDGLEATPPPFVLQQSMGDFTVVYQLNAHSRAAKRMNRIYSDLHAHIQDVFNEYGVQIMSPNYEADPQSPKVVPREQWYASPARPPEA